MEKIKTNELANGILTQNRRALAKAITLVESTDVHHQKEAHQILDLLIPYAGNSVRIGISGSPGVGKSTLIEVFGLWLIAQGKKVAVLTVDPSSVLSKGSILGDKTRMQRLSTHEDAFIRPSPSSGILGGVSLSTRETILLCEAFGFDVVIIETVGVGQSEIQVASMVDTFVLLLQPVGGDELQGIKKGILELADIVAITKCDGDLKEKAKQAKAQYKRSLSFIHSRSIDWEIPFLETSANQEKGLKELWQSVNKHIDYLKKDTKWKNKRLLQEQQWFWDLVVNNWLMKMKTSSDVQKKINNLHSKIKQKELSVVEAADQFINQYCDLIVKIKK